MIGRRTMLVCVLLAALGTPSVGRGAEVDDLKATAERLIAALNKGDLDTWSTLVHEQAVGFYAFSPFPVEGKANGKRHGADPPVGYHKGMKLSMEKTL